MGEPAAQGKRGIRPRFSVADLAFPVGVLLLLLVLTALRWSGTSSGWLRGFFIGSSPDPDLLWGSLRGIRSDEWLANTPVLVGQANSGFPRVNENLAGGLDVSVVYDVPYADWSVLFRPQNLGFGWLPLENAFALRWWLLSAVLLLACYALVLQVFIRSRAVAALCAAGLLLTPFLQWWGQGAVAHVAWSLTALVAFVWLLDGRGRPRLWVASALLGYATAAFGLLLYPPFQIPCLLVTAAAGAGLLVLRVRERGSTPLRLPVALSAASVVAGALVVAAFLLDRRDVVSTLRATDYPGARSVQAGGFEVVRLLYGFLTPRLLSEEAAVPGALAAVGGNQSEASTFLLLGVLLAGVQVWLLWRGRRQGLRANALLVALMAAAGALLAHALLPQAGALGAVLALSLVPHERAQLGLGLCSLLLLLATLAELRRQGVRAPWWLTALSAGATLLLLIAVAVRVEATSPVAAGPVRQWLLLAVLVAVLVGAAARGHARVALGGLLAFSLLAGAAVNPVYRGVFRTDRTAVGEAVARLDAAAPGGWVNTTGLEGNPVLVEAGVLTYSAAFSYPLLDGWRELDPEGRYRSVYNRFAHVVFAFDVEGEPLQLLQQDVVLVDFDPCGVFAQTRIRHVLAGEERTSPCLRLAERLSLPTRQLYLYDVVDAP